MPSSTLMVSTNGYIRLLYYLVIFFSPVAPGSDAAARLEVQLAVLPVDESDEHAAVHHPVLAHAGDAGIEPSVVILSPTDYLYRPALGSSGDRACRKLLHDDVAQMAAVAGRQQTGNLRAGLEDVAAVGVESVDIAVTLHGYTTGDPAKVVAYQVDDGGMLSGLLLIGHQHLPGIGHAAADSTFHRTTANDAGGTDAHERLRREADETVPEPQLIEGTAAKEYLTHREVGVERYPACQICQVAVTRQHVPVNDSEFLKIFRLRQRMRLPGEGWTADGTVQGTVRTAAQRLAMTAAQRLVRTAAQRLARTADQRTGIVHPGKVKKQLRKWNIVRSLH